MSEPIYKVFQGRPTEAWFQLSSEEQSNLLRKVVAVLEKAGGKPVVLCDSSWASEEWPWFGLEQFPDIEAVQAHTKLLQELNWYRFIESRSLVGKRFEPADSEMPID